MTKLNAGIFLYNPKQAQKILNFQFPTQDLIEITVTFVNKQHTGLLI